MTHLNSFIAPQIGELSANYNFWSNTATELPSDYFSFSLRTDANH